jgi:adenine C2-methylase RlmN of 23S rRNA A2503 and tRNA A37
MNLTKALKHKKKLVKQADDMYVRFSKFNSYQKDSVGYDPEQAYNEWVRLTNDLINLKTKIHIANAGIADKIFKLGELKSMATKLRGIDTKEGIVKDRYSDVTIEYVAYMNLFDRDTRVKELEEQIETLQEEIEAYNALTMI